MARPTARIVVLAKSLRDFHTWCREPGHSPRDPAVMYASGPHVLRGLDTAQIVRYGNWRDRMDIRSLENAVAALEQARHPVPALEAAHV